MSKNNQNTRTPAVAAVASIVGATTPPTGPVTSTPTIMEGSGKARATRIDDPMFLIRLIQGGADKVPAMLADLSPAQHKRVVEMLEKAESPLVDAARKCMPLVGGHGKAAWGIGEAREFLGQLSGSSPWFRCPVESVMPGYNPEVHGKPGALLVTPRKDAKGEVYLEVRAKLPGFYMQGK